jgi:glycerate 2-kinase
VVSVLSSILRASILAADSRQALHRALIPRGNRLSVGKLEYDLDAYRHIYVLSAGKAAIPMTEVVSEVLGDRISDGCVVVPHGYKGSLKRIPTFQAGHPIPDRNGIKAAERCMELARKAGVQDLVVVLLSGGASALLPLPAEKITLRDKQRVTEHLLKSGARIDEVNTVRKHLSRLKGGRLAAEIYPASSLTLILSDVLSRDLSVIASGPTVPDPSTFGDAVTVIKRYDLWAKLPQSVKKHLQIGCRERYPETPKPGDAIFERAQHYIVSDNRAAVQAADLQAKALGFQVMVLTTTLMGEAREVARVFGSLAREIHHSGLPISRPACILAGGELTVSVKGRGRGGRAQEFVLAAAAEISNLPKTLVAGFGTDGLDGPTLGAGAVADGTTLDRARSIGLDPQKALANNNSYTFFKAIGDLLITGPTGTNVNDIYMLLMP